MSPGPGPKEPPFIQHALQAVAEAVGVVEAPVENAVERAAESVANGIRSAIERIHAAERVALGKLHAGELNAAAEVDAIWTKVQGLVSRFPSASDAAAKLENAFRDFEAALSHALPRL